MLIIFRYRNTSPGARQMADLLKKYNCGVIDWERNASFFFRHKEGLYAPPRMTQID
jgi:hypothetical protein